MIAFLIIGLLGMIAAAGLMLTCPSHRTCAECGRKIRIEQDCCDTQEN